MQERLRQLGGTLELGSTPKGTNVSAVSTRDAFRTDFSKAHPERTRSYAQYPPERRSRRNLSVAQTPDRRQSFIRRAFRQGTKLSPERARAPCVPVTFLLMRASDTFLSTRGFRRRPSHGPSVALPQAPQKESDNESSPGVILLC
jgi:hypothetical protein